MTYRSLPMALLRARDALMERYRPAYTTHGVTEQQWRVLCSLQALGELDASQLARASCVSPPSLTRMVRSLEERELITSRKSRKDGRRAMINITQEGRQLLDRVAPVNAGICAEVERLIGRDRITHLLSEMDEVTKALGKA